MESAVYTLETKNFSSPALIERCPKSMMLRELVKNALEAVDRSVQGSKQIEISPVLVDGARKLAIWTTGPWYGRRGTASHV